jgi:hypothetical protein
LPNLVVDELKGGLNGNGCYAVWYADYIAILISSKFLNTISELLQEAMNMVQVWCDRTQPSINPQTMEKLPFTRKRYFGGLEEPTLSGHTLQLTTEVKFL